MAQLTLVLIALTASLTAAWPSWSKGSTASESTAQSCGSSTRMRPNRRYDPEGQRIVGGVEARPGSHPWIVSLQTADGFHFCGGTIVSEDTVITAAHCLPDGPPGRIVAGAHDHRNPTSVQVSRPAKVISHENYDDNTSMNDIAVIKLATPFRFNSKIQPACLPAKGEQVPENTEGTVAGWGVTEEGSRDAQDVLMQVGVPTISFPTCRKMYRRQNDNGKDIYIDNATMLCAGYKQGAKDSCQGDSGGPFIFKNAQGTYTLQGVVSFGKGCARAGLPGVYARVSNYIDWITKAAGKSVQG